MIKPLVIVQFKFTKEEALIAQAKNPKAVLCDANNFSLVNFDNAEIVPNDKTEETAYLVSKAKGENPKPLSKKAKV